MKIKQWVAAVALAALGWSAQAEPYFFSKDGSTVWDQATGLVWMRCGLGQQWNGYDCAGEAQRYTFEAAQAAAKQLNAQGGFAGASDWQVPSIRQLVSIRQCSMDDVAQNIDLQDDGPRVAQKCGGVTLAINDLAFPNTSRWYWSSSPYVGVSGYAWDVNFNLGVVGYDGRGNDGGAVRLVRASQLLGSEAALAFPVDEARNRLGVEAKAEADRKARETKAEAERKVLEAKAEARERKDAADRAAAMKKLLAMGARGLYLEAGKAQRNGSVTHVNNRFDAGDLYELIVEKFPSSEYAVKATDQLTAMNRSSREQSAVRDAASRSAEALRDADRNASNRAACFSSVNSCVASCRSRGMSYDTTQYCVNNCQRNCN